MTSIVRSLGAPVIEPAGNSARSAADRADVVAQPAADRRDQLVHATGRTRPPSAPAPSTVPGSQTIDRSLRSRSTIIRFSARNFGSVRQPRAAARSSSLGRRAARAWCP